MDKKIEMKIETKFNIKQSVFMLFKDKVWNVKIYQIEIYIDKDGISIWYIIQKNPAGSQYTCRFSESELFTTKEDLLKSL